MTMLQQAIPVQDRALYEPMQAQVVALTRLTEHENLYTLELDDEQPLGHQPGQFVQVSLFGVGECPISICSSPTRSHTFDLCVRRVGEVTEHIHRLKEGDTVGVRGPLGRGFDVRDLHGKDVLIVAGGLGLAPARSLVQYILDERPRFGAFHLLLGCRSPDEILFTDETDEWQKDVNVNFLVTVDRPDDGWRGHSGVVTTLFRELPKLDPENTEVAIIGPPIMFKFTLLEVLARRLPETCLWCSLERRMQCGVGKCGHCQVNNLYVCKDGPVFRYNQLKKLREAL